MSSVICIESDDDDEVCTVQATEARPRTTDVIVLGDPVKVYANGNSDSTVTIDLEAPSTSSCSSAPSTKRIKPTLVSTELTSPSKKKVFGTDNSPDKTCKRRSKDQLEKGNSFKRTRLVKLSDNLGLSDGSDEEAPEPVEIKPETGVDKSSHPKLTKEFRKLIVTCKSVDSSVDMDKLVRKKLIDYYREVPPEFLKSKNFCDLVTSVTDDIKKSPHLIYLKITRIVEELKSRRVAELSQNPEHPVKQEPAGEDAEKRLAVNAKKDAQIKKLNKALVKLKKRIDELDKEEVDFDEDINSAHMKVERYKKRACQIYEKLCDVSGENKHAQRSVRKPIKFHGTVYPEFNKTLQAFVNRTQIFPDFFDVKKCLEHCDKLYNMKLRPEEIQIIARDAFIKVGKILQKRRKMDLYEMVSYFGGTEGDPADEDHELQDKLCRNKQHHSKISDLIDKFAGEQVQGNDGDPDHEDEDVKFDPSTLLLLSVSVEAEEPEANHSNASIDQLPDLQMVTKSEIEIVESIPTHDRGDIVPLPDSMLEDIENMVSNHVDSFDAIPDLDENLLSGEFL